MRRGRRNGNYLSDASATKGPGEEEFRATITPLTGSDKCLCEFPSLDLMVFGQRLAVSSSAPQILKTRAELIIWALTSPLLNKHLLR